MAIARGLARRAGGNGVRRGPHVRSLAGADRFCLRLSGVERPRGRSSEHHVAGDPQRRRSEGEGSRGQIRHPACRCHREVTAGQRHRDLCQSALPLLEAWRSQEEQWRAPARCAGRAQGAHRGRLWPRRHADRRLELGHHHQRDHAALQGERLLGRHRARRRRHHRRAHHRRRRMAPQGEGPIRRSDGGFRRSVSGSAVGGGDLLRLVLDP